MLGLLSLLLLPLSALAAPTTSSPCSDILIITARGSEELQALSTSQNTGFDGGEIVNVLASVGYAGTSGEGELGVVAQKIQNLIQKYTSLKISREAVFYPALLRDSSGAFSTTIYGTSLLRGIANFTKQIETQISMCPKQKLVLLGYSQGANLIGDALAGGGGCYGSAPSNCSNPFYLETEEGLIALKASYAPFVSAIVFWGDPRHSQAAQTIFTTGFPSPKLSGFFPRTPDSEAVLAANYCDGKVCKIQSICDAQDYFCGSGAQGANSVNVTASNIIHDYNYLKTQPVNLSVKFALTHLGYASLASL